MHIYIYIYIYINVLSSFINFVIATISFVLNVTGDLLDLQTLPQPCNIKNKADCDSMELDDNDNNNNKNNFNTK